jgi:ketosteroid isomerase-like protein
MSDENVQIVRRSFEVWNERDVDAIRRLYTDDVVIETPEVFAVAGPTFAGNDPVGRFVAGLKREWIDSRWEGRADLRLRRRDRELSPNHRHRTQERR